MSIQNPRRILVLGRPDSAVTDLTRSLTGSAPEPVDNSIAGLSHEYEIATQYYTATVPIWLDEVPDLDLWRTDFMKPEAKEVIQAVGGWIYCFRTPVTSEDLRNIQSFLKDVSDVVEHAGGYGWEGVKLAVAMPQSTTPYIEKSWEEWEEVCGEHGFEYIDFEAKGRNEFGEPTGIDRVKEALAANDWSPDIGDLDDEDTFLDSGTQGEGFDSTFAAEEAEMNIELLNMKTALQVDEDAGADTNDTDEAAQVEELQRMMSKMHAIKDMASSMPEDERKRFAAKAINNLMKAP